MDCLAADMAGWGSFLLREAREPCLSKELNLRLGCMGLVKYQESPL
jgi:hypothetical protein